MRTTLKLSATLFVFGIFYAGAFLIMQGAQNFEKRGDVALFTSKADAAAIANAEQDEGQALTGPSNGVWKQ